MTQQVKQIIYLEKGCRDATHEEDWYQCIGINPTTFEVVDKVELVFESDIPDTNYVKQTWDNILSVYELKGWKLQ
jgi:hypothetical protein